MADDEHPSYPPPRPYMDKAARQAARARINRLSRLPFLYDFALRGRAQAFLATLVQTALVIVLSLGPTFLVTGELLPPGVVFIALLTAFALQWLSRYLNARAGRT